VIWIIFLDCLINSSFAQSSDDFEKYTNHDLKFSIEHPSDWKVDDDIRKGDTQIHFTIRQSEIKEEDNPFLHLPASFWDSYLKVGVEEIEINFDIDPMTVKNISIAERVKEDIDFMSFNPDRFGLFGQHQVTVGRNLGWKSNKCLITYREP
jgi:hypothetical protein